MPLSHQLKFKSNYGNFWHQNTDQACTFIVFDSHKGKSWTTWL